MRYVLHPWSRRLFILPAILSALMFAACSGEGIGPEVEAPDAGIEDAGIGDAGAGDAGIEDAGIGDAGAGDAGIGEAGECTDAETREVACAIEGPRTVQPQRCVDGAWQDDGACACEASWELDPLLDVCVEALACNEAGAPFGGGNGTEEAPFLVCSAAHLQAVSTALGAHLALAQSLDLSGVADFSPIGTDSAPFTGVFDGKGRALVGLVLELPDDDYVGLFGQMGDRAASPPQEGVVRDLTLMDFKVTGHDSVGALVGRLEESRVERVGVRGGTVSGGKLVGGVVGYSFYSSVSGSYATSTVSGTDIFVGGLTGANLAASVSESYATGTVSGANNVGGLVGRNYADSSVSESYAAGAVSGTGDYVGGLVGRNYSKSSVSGSYAAGAVSGTGDYVGGLVGRNTSYSFVSESYATGDVSGADYVGGLVGDTDDSSGLSESYAMGTVSGTGSSVGRLVGKSSSTVTACFALEQGGLPLIGDGSTDLASRLLSSAELALEITFTDAGWDFTEVWTIAATTPERPRLQWQAP